ncbi:DUF1214 domain-containing protein [Aggregicoccus sp. 17bor-14]|nr:DUF1214 domain-containing protein [Aggregicoccus sp. 17bor-14]
MLTDYVDPAQRANWLPAPAGDFSLYIRAYWPQERVTHGRWTPPPCCPPESRPRGAGALRLSPPAAPRGSASAPRGARAGGGRGGPCSSSPA